MKNNLAICQIEYSYKTRSVDVQGSKINGQISVIEKNGQKQVEVGVKTEFKFKEFIGLDYKETLYGGGR